MSVNDIRRNTVEYTDHTRSNAQQMKALALAMYTGENSSIDLHVASLKDMRTRPDASPVVGIAQQIAMHELQDDLKQAEAKYKRVRGNNRTNLVNDVINPTRFAITVLEGALSDPDIKDIDRPAFVFDLIVESAQYTMNRTHKDIEKRYQYLREVLDPTLDALQTGDNDEHRKLYTCFSRAEALTAELKEAQALYMLNADIASATNACQAEIACLLTVKRCINEVMRGPDDGWSGHSSTNAYNRQYYDKIRNALDWDLRGVAKHAYDLHSALMTWKSLVDNDVIVAAPEDAEFYQASIDAYDQADADALAELRVTAKFLVR